LQWDRAQDAEENGQPADWKHDSSADREGREERQVRSSEGEDAQDAADASSGASEARQASWSASVGGEEAATAVARRQEARRVLRILAVVDF